MTTFKPGIENCDTGLAKKMIAWADANGCGEDHPMRVRARDFEEATRDVFTGKCSVPRFMGIWVLARRCYIEHTGKRLMDD